MKKLSIKQINNLLVGTRLATELISDNIKYRTFISIGAYKESQDSIGGESLSKFSSDNKDAVFLLRKYDVKKDDLDADIYFSESDLVNSYYKDNISNIEELENELANFIDDFSVLEVSWNCDNPV